MACELLIVDDNSMLPWKVGADACLNCCVHSLLLVVPMPGAQYSVT